MIIFKDICPSLYPYPERYLMYGEIFIVVKYLTIM